MQDSRINTRDSSMELLRIISMLMIVFHHFATHGGFMFESPQSIPYIWYSLINIGGKIGLSLFVMISGYYLITNTNKLWDIKKIIKYVGQTTFYAVVTYVIAICLKIVPVNILTLIYACYPIIYRLWSFVTDYFVLYLMHPFLNRLLNTISKKTYQKILLVMITYLAIIPSLTFFNINIDNSILWFILLYMIAGYIRLYGFNNKLRLKNYVIVCMITFSAFFILNIINVNVYYKYNVNLYKTLLLDVYDISTLTMTILIFMIFVTIKIKHNKIINIIASGTFGVFLLHDSEFIRKVLWIDLFKNAQYQNSLFLIPYSIIIVLLVFIIGIFVDIFRQYFIEKPCMHIMIKYLDKNKIHK